MLCPVMVAGMSAALAAVVRLRLADGSAVSERALARRAGLSQPQIANWLAGRRALSMRSFDQVRGALGVPWCELLGCGVCSLCPREAAPRLRGVA
jgi:transcriptional regulator with XRE-family HTH domain